MTKDTWSIKQIQDMVEPKEEWGEKKTIYATDSDKCQTGVYYALMGEKKVVQTEPEDIRRMDVGSMIEYNQIKKLKRLGLLIEPEFGGQHRLENKEYGVSGRIDALIISPTRCTPRAKAIIKRKVELNATLEAFKKNLYKGLDRLAKGEITEEAFLEGKLKLTRLEHDAFNEIRLLNKELLIPNPKNELMAVEIKSISEWGFKYRQEEGTPMESHENQALFYISELRKTYPNIVARVLYVAVPYQHLLEFDVQFDEQKYQDLVKKWVYLRECFNKKKPPEPCPDVILNNKTGKWNVNKQAEWCDYHPLCTGDPGWMTKAMDKVKSLNSSKTKSPEEKVEKKIKKEVKSKPRKTTKKK